MDVDSKKFKEEKDPKKKEEMVKKKEERDEVGLYNYANSFSTSLIWVLGKLAKSLMYIPKKEEEKKDEEKKDEVEDKKKKEIKERKQVIQLMTQSNLLSGGLDIENLGIFKIES